MGKRISDISDPIAGERRKKRVHHGDSGEK
jgi:hypothetical protein